MDLLILNICETSVTTFLAHSWKESSGLSVNRAELDRTGQRISPGTLTGLSVKRCCWFLWLKLGTVMPREAGGILPGAANGSLSAFVLKGLSSILPASTSLLAVPHGIFAPFLSNSFFFFFLCPDFRQVTCTCCRVWSQQSRLTPRCDKRVYVKRCRAALERFNVSNNNTIRRRRHPRTSFAFMLQTVDRARSLLSHVKCVRCICPSASWPPTPVVPFSWNVVLNVTFSCPSICSHTAFGKTKTAPPHPQQPPLTMAIPITATKSSCEKWEGQVPQRSGRQTHTHGTLGRTSGECKYKMSELLVSRPLARVALSFLMLKETKIVIYFDTRGEVYFCNED